MLPTYPPQHSSVTPILSTVFPHPLEYDAPMTHRTSADTSATHLYSPLATNPSDTTALWKRVRRKNMSQLPRASGRASRQGRGRGASTSPEDARGGPAPPPSPPMSSVRAPSVGPRREARASTSAAPASPNSYFSHAASISTRPSARIQVPLHTLARPARRPTTASSRAWRQPTSGWRTTHKSSRGCRAGACALDYRDPPMGVGGARS